MATIDDRQQEVIEGLYKCSSLVLAGPGCGKTHLLARRVLHAALYYGVPFEKMLCITFTNRAAREMQTRVEAYIGAKPDGLFVGNIHRFCLRFLYANNIISDDTNVIDDDDLTEFLASTLGITRQYDIASFLKKKAYLYQIENDHPAWTIRTHREGLDDNDYYRIESYRQYMAENRLIDYDDMLLLTYSALMQHNAADYEMTGYTWAQVDEVQDLTPLQLAIVDRVTHGPDRTLIYFGDEQQAIFDFTGAGGDALDALKSVCRSNILRLEKNYRSPDYLVDMCNELAVRWLGISRKLLPRAVNNADSSGNMLRFSGEPDYMKNMAAKLATQLLAETEHESVAVLVRTNSEGEELARYFEEAGLEHFHISRQDVFHQIPFKTVWAHLSAVLRPVQSQPWARILYQLGAVRTLMGARRVMHMLRHSCVSPAELLEISSPGVVERVCAIENSKETVVIFDTETTGLDIFEDDVVQIAAVKVRGGKIVEGSEFEVFIKSNRPLPKTLANGVANPLSDIFSKAEQLPAQEAYQAFIDYIGSDTVLASHNLDFDCNILANNIRRHTTLEPPVQLSDKTRQIDTLELSHLLFPRLNNHRLENLIKYLGLEGVNSHNALDDVMATAALYDSISQIAASRLDVVRRCKNNIKIRRIAEIACRKYSEFYHAYRKALVTDGGSLAEAVEDTAQWFFRHGYTGRLERSDYIKSLIDKAIVDQSFECNFRDQLSAHIYDLLTFSESDLFSNGIVKERLSIMTIHKAKGLEMDNVILYDASRAIGRPDDIARVLYVALSRSRRRLAIGIGSSPSRPLMSVMDRFRPVSDYFDDCRD